MAKVKLDSPCSLFIRNVRGDFFLRAAIQYQSENIAKNSSIESFMVDLKNLEVLPPAKFAPILLRASTREFVRSKFSKVARAKCSWPKEKVIKLSTVRKIRAIFHAVKYLASSLLHTHSSSKIQNLNSIERDASNDIQTLLTSLYGVKHFEFDKRNLILKRTLAIFRYFYASKLVRDLLLEGNFSSLLLINGRDAVGLASQRVARKLGVQIYTLERAVPFSETRYVVFRGSLQHWWVKESAYKEIAKLPNFTSDQARDYMNSNFGMHTKYWMGDGRPPRLDMLRLQKFVVFFTSSERESVSFSDEQGRIDEFDQTTQVLRIVKLCLGLHVTPVIRLHPNLGRNGLAKRESDYWKKVLKEFNDVQLVDNNVKLDSYALASKAILNVVYRSSLAAEFAFRKLPFICCAESAFTSSLTHSLATDSNQMEIALKRAIIGEKAHSEDRYWINFAKYYALLGQKLRET